MVTAPSIGFSAQPDGVHAANSLRSDRFHIRGLSWFGAEGAGAAPDSLWQRKASDLIGIVNRLGFNALRLPQVCCLCELSLLWHWTRSRSAWTAHRASAATSRVMLRARDMPAQPSLFQRTVSS